MYLTPTTLETIQEHPKSNNEKVKMLLPDNLVCKTTNLEIGVIIGQHDY